MSTYANRCTALRELLSDRKEHAGAELEAIGGRRFGARVHSIRRGEDGLPALQVECETRGSESYWTARPYRPDEPRPGKRRSVAHLEARVAELEAELALEKNRNTKPQLTLFEAQQGAG